MKYVTRTVPIAVAVVVLFLVGALGFITLGGLQQEAGHIVRTTLPRLSVGANINSDQAENFIRALLVITADNPQERTAYLQEVAGFNQKITAAIVSYRQSLQSDEDRRLVDDLEQTRQRYHAIRQQAFDLCDRGQKAEALALMKTSLWPAYKAYTLAGDKLVATDMAVGEARGERIMKVCSLTRVVVAIIGIVIFIGGFVTPFIAMHLLAQRARARGHPPSSRGDDDKMEGYTVQ